MNDMQQLKEELLERADKLPQSVRKLTTLKFLRKQVESATTPDELTRALDNLETRVAKEEEKLSWGTAEEVRELLKNKDVRNFVKAKYGDAMRDTWLGWCNYVQDVGDEGPTDGKWAKMTDRLRKLRQEYSASEKATPATSQVVAPDEEEEEKKKPAPKRTSCPACKKSRIMFEGTGMCQPCYKAEGMGGECVYIAWLEHDLKCVADRDDLRKRGAEFHKLLNKKSTIRKRTPQLVHLLQDLRIALGEPEHTLPIKELPPNMEKEEEEEEEEQEEEEEEEVLTSKKRPREAEVEDIGDRAQLEHDLQRALARDDADFGVLQVLARLLDADPSKWGYVRERLNEMLRVTRKRYYVDFVDPADAARRVRFVNKPFDTMADAVKFQDQVGGDISDVYQFCVTELEERVNGP